MSSSPITFSISSAPPNSSVFTPDVPLASLGLARPRRHLVSQSISTVTLVADGTAADAPPLLPYGSTVIIYITTLNITTSTASTVTKTQWFFGRITKIPAKGSGRAESQTYEISDPWWYLENLVYQQQWVPPNFPGATPVNDPYRSHCFLNKWVAKPQPGGGLHYTRQPTDQQIQDAVDFAKTFNALPLQLAPDIPSMDIPLEEVRDITCAEVIRKQLRWMPDAVTYFDYATTPPTLYITRRADLIPVSISLTPQPGAPLVASFQVSPRHDLFHPAVAIKFEQINQVTVAGHDQQWLITTPQVYPPTATGHELQALVLTVSLEGLNDKVAAGTIEVGAVQISPDLDPSRDDWWLSKQPWLQRCNSAKINRLTFETAHGPGLPTAAGSTYSNELLSGQIAPWMGCAAADCLVTAEIEYHTKQPVPGDPPSGPFSGLPENVAQRTVSVKVTMTNAIVGAQTLYSLANGIRAETIPANLAQTLYQSVGFVPYEGSIKLIEPECSGLVRVGHTLNLTGSASDGWAGMSALVQQVVEDLEIGATSITFGSPSHLGVPDLIELLRLNRFRIVYSNPATQIETAQIAGQLQLGQQTALENSTGGGDAHSQFGAAAYYDAAQPANLQGGQISSFLPSPPSTTPVTLSDPAQGTGTLRGSSLKLGSPNSLPAAPVPLPADGSITLRQCDCNGKDLYIQEVQICVDGVVKNIMIPCSTPY